MSTFLKETDLAGLKVCSVSSSPSIVSVQSERGASCNSKLSHQSTPGPTLKISTKTTGWSQLRACSRGFINGMGWWWQWYVQTLDMKPGPQLARFKKCNNNHRLLQSDWKHHMASWFSKITTYTISVNGPLHVSHFTEMHVNVVGAHLQAPTHSASQAALCRRHEYIPKQRSIAHPSPSIYTAPGGYQETQFQSSGR